MLLPGTIRTLHLQRRVMQVEAVLQASLDLQPDGLAVGARGQHHVAGQERLLLRDRPQVDVMHAGDAVSAGDGVAHRAQAHAGRHAFEQQVDAFAQQHPGAREHHESDGHGQRRIDPAPAGQPDDHGPRDDGDRTQHVGPDFEIGAFHVQAVVLGTGQQPHRHQIDHQPGDGHGQHAGGLDIRRRLETAPGFVQDVERHAQQHQRVDRGRQDLEARITVSAHQVGGLAARADRDQRQQQRDSVGHHVHGVGDQRQTAGPQAPDDLHHHEGAGQPERDPQAGFGQRPHVGVLMAAAHAGPRETIATRAWMGWLSSSLFGESMARRSG
ncbi:hypothetical protein BBAD15_g12573 [Beauveria bassiana D1-5]|uniref:Uncharacterized protein n=1 Tax=Beauveria bassiana D1-5 TaxID=1245745 RepID=A0A0A2V439_BEABA|nr:hypothetical protein BBAD15_g12573 [Beauveria bassiana D1-5]